MKKVIKFFSDLFLLSCIGAALLIILFIVEGRGMEVIYSCAFLFVCVIGFLGFFGWFHFLEEKENGYHSH